MNTKDLVKLKVWQAYALQLIVPILLLCNGGVLLDSISAYVNFTPLAFGALFMTAAMLFFQDGFIFRERRHNVTLGIALFFIMVLNHKIYPEAHYAFAIYFFVASNVLMVWKSSKKQRWWKWLIFSGTAIAAILCAFGWISILAFEWIGMIPMSVHFAGEATGKID